MTSLFRQGVETVCKGEREREKECKSPLQKEVQVGLGAGRGAVHRALGWD